MEDYLELAIDLSQRAGCTYAEARYQMDYYETNLLKNGVPEVSSFNSKKGVGIRVIKNGALGFAATNQLNRREISSLVKKVVSSTGRASSTRSKPITLADSEPEQGRVEIKTRIPFDGVTLEGRLDLLEETDSAAMESAENNGIKLPGRYLSLQTLVTEKMVMTSDGARVFSRIPRVSSDMFFTALSTEK